MPNQDKPDKSKAKNTSVRFADLVKEEKAKAKAKAKASVDEGSPKPGSKAAQWQAIWQGLDERQRAYLLAVYQTDQEKEVAEKKKGWQPGDRKIPASQWRWLLYRTDHWGEDTPLKKRIRDAKLLEDGTQFTFASLLKVGLIERKYPDKKSPFFPERGITFFIKISLLGRKVVRQATNSAAPKAPPVGTLSANQWKALVALYQAAHSAGIRYPKEYNAGISQRTLDRLENHVDGALASKYIRLKNLVPTKWDMPAEYAEKTQTWLRLTREGARYYHRSYSYCAALYPDITPPNPPTREQLEALEDLYDQVDFMVAPTGYIESYVNLRLLSQRVRERVVSLAGKFSSNGVHDALKTSLAAVENARLVGQEVNPQDIIALKLQPYSHNILVFGTQVSWQATSRLRDLCSWVGLNPQMLIWQSKFVRNMVNNRLAISLGAGQPQPGEIQNRELHEQVLNQIQQDNELTSLSRKMLEQVLDDLLLVS